MDIYLCMYISTCIYMYTSAGFVHMCNSKVGVQLRSVREREKLQKGTCVCGRLVMLS